LRAFIAIPIPEDCLDRLEGFVGSLRRLVPEARFVRKEQFHITLHFFGAIHEDEAQAICSAMEALLKGEKGFRVVLSGLGAFPSERNPRVLWLGLKEGALQCREIQEKLEAHIRSLGIATEERDFHPHLTLARFKDFSRKCQMRLEELPSFEIAFFAGSVVFYQSELRGYGAIHTPLLTCNLISDA
jgi:2'-5' RNA ligase